MLKTICYISDSMHNESLKNIEDLYLKARTNNAKNNITGILMYTDRNFLQVLEGEETIVDATFKKICADIRHKNIFNIIDSPIEQRIFEDYNFGFTTINNKQELNNLFEYLNWLKNADCDCANKVIAMVENFIMKNKQS
ncbi:BLUF domain-containing protein [Mariniflexile maritimum]|uniref:BLUF domain-containing protein n=1 Tax=Mariniflexile maritimum TaxID=2682493 RepID=UPI0012F6DBA0|nr:BLUF domain-containing protein [Mariniflexile maritimum]HMR16100.1 BLUF domain-containing protein [Mariniflexile sp.]